MKPPREYKVHSKKSTFPKRRGLCRLEDINIFFGKNQSQLKQILDRSSSWCFLTTKLSRKASLGVSQQWWMMHSGLHSSEEEPSPHLFFPPPASPQHHGRFSFTWTPRVESRPWTFFFFFNPLWKRIIKSLVWIPETKGMIITVSLLLINTEEAIEICWYCLY